MPPTRRSVLRNVGGSAALGTGITITSAENAGPDQSSSGNLGVFNNGQTTREITLTISKNEEGLYSEDLVLAGRNDPATTDPAQTRFRGDIGIDTPISDTFNLVAETADGQRDSAPVRIERGGVSEFEVMSVYVWHDGELEVLVSQR